MGVAVNPAEDGRRTRWTGQRELRRREFVDAALVLVEAQGPGVSVADIAASVGVGRPVVYRHFTGKADLEHAMADAAAAQARAVVVPTIAVDGNLPASLRSALSAYVGWVVDHPALFRMLRTHAATAPDSPWSLARSAVADRVSTVAIEQAGVTEDAGFAALAGTLAAGLVGMVEASVTQWFDSPRGVTAEQLVDFLAPVLLGAMTAVGHLAGQGPRHHS